MRIAVVTPTYNEAESIGEFIRQVQSNLPEASIIIVDDNSPDGTANVVQSFDGFGESIFLLARPGKFGLGSAYRDGFRYAIDKGAELIVEMDADLSHDPLALPQLTRAIDGQSADAIVGSRYIKGGHIPNWTWHRRALSRWGNRYAGWVLGLGVNDATSGYRVFRPAALEAANFESLKAEGYGFQIEMAYALVRAGQKVVESPINFLDRKHGKSKMSGPIVIEALLLVTWWAIRDRVFGRIFRRSS